MFLHAISPSRSFTKVPNALFRRTELDAASRLLLAHIGGLPSAERYAPLSKHAEDLGLKPGTYKRVKKELLQHGYVHDYRAQGEDGRWYTDQWVSNVPLTKEEFTALRTGAATAAPGGPEPTAGAPGDRSVGRSTGTAQTNSKTSPTRPPQDTREAPAVAETAANTPQSGGNTDRAPHFARAEQILWGLKTVRKDLSLTFRDVRYLAANIADRLHLGVPAWEIHSALTHGLPADPIRNAAGFVTHRLATQVPDAAALAAADAARQQQAAEAEAARAAVASRQGPRECGGPGRPGPHAFVPLGDETLCDPCRREYPMLAELVEEERGGAWAPLRARVHPDPAF
ncbi:hypothetical protein ACIP93_08790 [Streptomyces sp. NPDC088745]|uniref:hypothetical protein n=1 Tax=Streptomyces sp. NPDC088745 TaxID=3365884 RepID=UPI0038256C28